MVPVSMAYQQDLDVAEVEAEPLHACPDQGKVVLRAAVYENVPLRSRDQVAREFLTSDVVQVAGDTERRKWVGPLRTGLGTRALRAGERYERRREQDAAPRLVSHSRRPPAPPNGRAFSGELNERSERLGRNEPAAAPWSAAPTRY